MAGRNAIQILRGTSSQISSSNETLLDGQLLYNKTTNQLFIGNGDQAVNNATMIMGATGPQGPSKFYWHNIGIHNEQGTPLKDSNGYYWNFQIYFEFPEFEYKTYSGTLENQMIPSDMVSHLNYRKQATGYLQRNDGSVGGAVFQVYRLERTPSTNFTGDIFVIEATNVESGGYLAAQFENSWNVTSDLHNYWTFQKIEVSDVVKTIQP